MTNTLDPTRLVGSWTNPETGEMFVEDLRDPQKQAEWLEWLPGVVCVIESGFYDRWIYEIAAACHRRHLATNGQAAPDRPEPPATQGLPWNNFADHLVIKEGQIRPVSGATRVPDVEGKNDLDFFAYRGRTYRKASYTGRAFLAPSNFNAALRGVWLKIEDITATPGVVNAIDFKVRVVTEPDQPGVRLGQTLNVRAQEIDTLFARSAR